MNNCSICKFNDCTYWDEPCNSCTTTKEKPRGTHWEFNHGDKEFIHPCNDCARSGNNGAYRSCYFPEYEGIFKKDTCGHENQYYKFLPLSQSKVIIPEEEEEVPFPIENDTDEDLGTAATSPHYNSLPVQPIELMEAMLTREEFLGFLKGNMIKYSMRAGRKDDTQKDVNKYNQYKEFYEYASQPEHSISDLVK